MTLPPPGTPAREALHNQALQLAIGALEAQPGRIADALYLVYSEFRLHLLEERGLLDVVPGRDAASVEALQDARSLEKYVAERCGAVLLRGFTVDC